MPVQPARLALALLLLRLALGVFLLQFGVEKFVVPATTTAIFRNFYGLAVDGLLPAGLGAAQVALALALLAGVLPRYSYGLAMLLHAVTTLVTLPRLIAPWNPVGNHLFIAGVPVLAAFVALFLLREADLWTLPRLLGRAAAPGGGRRGAVVTPGGAAAKPRYRHPWRRPPRPGPERPMPTPLPSLARRRLPAIAGCLLLAVRPARAAAPEIYTPENGLALGGYDPVAYFVAGRPVLGQARFETGWRGARWRFASQANLDRFLAAPEAYAPQYGGYCAWALGARDALAPGDGRHWRIVDGKLYVNYDGAVAKMWAKDIPGFIAAANPRWPAILTR